MAHLKKGADGHLLKTPQGHLVKECAGGAANECNACSPAIPDTLYGTLAGAAGSLAVMNAKHQLDWGSSCNWKKTAAYQVIWLISDTAGWPDLSAHVPNWFFFASGSGYPFCRMAWKSDGADSCDPTGSYNLIACEDTQCPDTDSCEDSGGATFAVSLS